MTTAGRLTVLTRHCVQLALRQSRGAPPAPPSRHTHCVPLPSPRSILVQFEVVANDTDPNSAAIGTWDLMAQIRAIGGAVNL